MQGKSSRFGRICDLHHASASGLRNGKNFRGMAQNKTVVVETGRVRKVVQISTMVHQEKDWAFIALCDDGSLWLYHGSWSRIESVPQTPDP